MSDARPITNVTDFVCGSCWNSFSRSDPGVEQGNQLVCPHCKHTMALDAGLSPMEALAAMSASDLRGSDEFDIVLRDQTAHGDDGGGSAGASTIPRRGSDGFADLLNAKTERSADDIGDGIVVIDESESLTHISDGFGVESAQTTLRAEVELGGSGDVARVSGGWLPPDLVARSAEPAGFIVGEPDDADEFDFEEQTLRPDVSREGLLAAVRNTEQTPDLEDIPELAIGEEPLGLDASAPIDQDAGAPDLPPSEELALDPDDPEGRDWKLKAIGLTYNFHGLDALIGWANNKAGQTMQVSTDGATWKDFESFFALYRSGTHPMRAFEQAMEPGAPAAAAPVPELAAPSARANRQTLSKMPGVDALNAKSDQKVRNTGPTPKADATIPGTRNSGQAAAVKAPTSSPSKRAIAASAAQQGSGSNTRAVQVAAVIALIAVVAVAVLAWQGMIVLPGMGGR